MASENDRRNGGNIQDCWVRKRILECARITIVRNASMNRSWAELSQYSKASRTGDAAAEAGDNGDSDPSDASAR